MVFGPVLKSKHIRPKQQGAKSHIKQNLIDGRSASKTNQTSFSASVTGAGIEPTLWKNLICITLNSNKQCKD